MTLETMPLLLLEPLMHQDTTADMAPNSPLLRTKATLAPPPRWYQLQHTLVLLVLDIVPDTILGFLVQYSRDDPGARILTAFTFASILQSQVVATLLVSLHSSLESLRVPLTDPLKRRELWVLAQAAWIVYMSYLPLAALVCGYLAWRLRDAILGQNADVCDVVATLLVINLVSLPFSLGSAILRKELLESQHALRPFVIASCVSWSIGLSFAYVLGYWVELGFVGIALTDILTYGIQFRLLAPLTSLLTEWPGWHVQEAMALVPRLARHPTMVGVMLVNLAMMLFGFTSLLASLIKVERVIEDSQHNVFPSLQMLTSLPLMGVSVWCAQRINVALKPATESTSTGRSSHWKVRVFIVVAGVVSTVVVTVCWLIGALRAGEISAIHPDVVRVATSVLSVLVPAVPPLGFLLATRPVFRTCVELWTHVSSVFTVAVGTGFVAGVMFADQMDGGVQGLWYGQYTGITLFIVVAAVSIRRWIQRRSLAASEEETRALVP